MAQVVRGDASHLDALEPLWLALRAHHLQLTGHWGPAREPDDAWARRRQTYLDVLAEGGALFLAYEADALVGHALCETEEGQSPTWQWPATFFAINDLVVLPEARGRGVGEALMHAIHEEARARGVEALDLMVVAPNDGARRFYERHGFRADLVTYRKPL